MTQKFTLKTAAVSAGVFTAAMVPQICDADIVTVGGDGGVGSVSMRAGQQFDVGGLLQTPFVFTASFSYLSFAINGSPRIGMAARSSVSTLGSLINNNRIRFNSGGSYVNGYIRSDDNWIPGEFRVNGVNGGDLVYGWLHVDFSNSDRRLVSFTYDSDATDATPFVKPIGGFTVSTIPEPSSLAGLALLACGAAGVRRRRQLAA